MIKNKKHQTSLTDLLQELNAINTIWGNLRNYPTINMNIFIAYRYTLPNTILDSLLLPRLPKYRKILKNSLEYENLHELLLQIKLEYDNNRNQLTDFEILKNAVDNTLDAYDILPELYASYEKYALFVYYNLLFEKVITIEEALQEFNSIRLCEGLMSEEMIFFFHKNEIVNPVNFCSVFSKYNLQFSKEFITWYEADTTHKDYTYYKKYHVSK